MSSSHLPSQSRDPIMDDDKFSLRFGNPIQEIHNTNPSKATTFTPYQNLNAPSIIYNGTEKTQHAPKSTNKSNHTMFHPSLSSSINRDVGNFADFYHKTNGRVDEIDH
ncbi:uncharacterized protein BX664DRAFT_372392 [Halteromyces radiatus]|uniref:uncharacterized protein n=1 Tax=Halteromyces radiatus TaxID=101107 RepID=UPI00221F1AE9|nr:uncharacterized protein BX664DRAFT_372392 [Halteromyces radiatus]KAI8093503.1 hypothetical protein BX664DRAFT_372392 [Halteromyces radiatus]